jgi:hypothetical protein
MIADGIVFVLGLVGFVAAAAWVANLLTSKIGKGR